MSHAVRNPLRHVLKVPIRFPEARAVSSTQRVRDKDKISSWKDSRDVEKKDDIVRETTEYSKTGSDDQVAQDTKTAFGAKNTSPEEQLGQAAGESAKAGQNNNPLEVSPANVEVSRAATQRPEHIDLRVARGVSREPSSGGQSLKASKGRKYDTVPKDQSTGAGAAG